MTSRTFRISIVDTENWQAIYLDGKKTGLEDHHISQEELLTFIHDLGGVWEFEILGAYGDRSIFASGCMPDRLCDISFDNGAESKWYPPERKIMAKSKSKSKGKKC